ncbi:response regulator transcription factor [Aestuariirhabdus sp. Z084]|uniref:response regulator transcription factor n=1 Tax=Aestuariirhabdus haliotis TaxID=2918751 RepID=UPI00201B360E|nr:response regulator transcription factor [Aestuariirhabdus haliotis]MCL6415086.1 response regulator transcription factor [Aestuariirhabdus haliotis]MCL6419018.1 response regulator transcription factor [Aestuariirhabdus haliotis]
MRTATKPPGSDILVVEDDTDLNEQLTQLLRAAGYCVDQCHDGETALVMLTSKSYQLVVLDIMLPRLDGLSLLAKLRQTHQIPVVIVSARGAEEERIHGLSLGADDYLSKPFNTTELLLRIAAILRRSRDTNGVAGVTELHLNGLKVDTSNRVVSVNGRMLELTPIQFRLLSELISRQGELLTKADLYRSVLNRRLVAHDRSLDMHLSRVRRKLNQAGWSGERLQTVHGKGYCIA